MASFLQPRHRYRGWFIRKCVMENHNGWLKSTVDIPSGDLKKKRRVVLIDISLKKYVQL